MDTLYVILGSSALAALISGIFGLLQGHRSKIRKQLEMLERDGLRTQLLVMISLYPDETTDILRLAQHYFVTLNGNWVLSDIFFRWARENEIQLPPWAESHKTTG